MSDADYEYEDVCLCRHHVTEHRDTWADPGPPKGVDFAECSRCDCKRFRL